MSHFKLIESNWQKYWAKHPELYKAQEFSNSNFQFSKPKKYILNEFPYPSGSGLHVGHAFSFVGGDVYARYKRMQGDSVLFPMGWDAFGLPTENYAIKMKRKPQEVTHENTDMFRNQMKRLAFSYDWDREINTTDPAYYKWTQWIFIQLFKKGLAYKKEMPINWCPSCKIGLANEEVVDSKCERCGAEVSRRNISQWIVRITEYADKLIEGLKETKFIDKVKQSQINWIGKSEGSNVRFKLSPDSISILSSSHHRNIHSEACGRKIDISSAYNLEVFTTRPDTLFGATFIVIAPEHPLAYQLEEQKEEIENYVKNTKKKSEMERTGISTDKTGVFSGLYAINPVNDKKIPIWISDFVLVSYGTGAIMSVPAHDDRDLAFAKKFGLDIIPVFNDEEKAINSDFLNGLDQKKAFEKMIKWLEEKKIGEKTASYHLRDWIFSRQHYWGEPIPMIFCENCKNQPIRLSANQLVSYKEKIKQYAKENSIEVKVLENNPGWYPVEEKQLPIVLPEVDVYEPTDDGKSPLSKIESFVKCKCPVCGGEAVRETDTMPNWAGSDWYYLAYCFANKIKNKASDIVGDIFSDSQKEIKYWGPVDVYIGGDEHNVLHLLYSRFIHQFLWDLGVLPKEIKEPYYKRISHGVILGPDGQRMSKSKGNVIVPEVVADKYGVDVVRMYLMFMGPFDSTMAWNENTLMGVKRFLDRFCQFIRSQISDFSCQGNKISASSKEVKVIINKLIKSVSEDFESFKYNTAMAKMMEALNSLSAIQPVSLSGEDIKTLIKLIAPLAPYTAEELWAMMSGVNDGSLVTDDYVSVHLAQWPVVEEKFLIEDIVIVAVAINGKVRSQISIDRSQVSDKNVVLNMAKDDKKTKKWIEDSRIVKEIYVEGKMVNIVLL